MRKILKDTCIFAALMVLVIFSYSITVVGLTDEIKLVFEIFGLAFVLAVFNYLFDEKTSFSIIAGYLIKYVVVSVVVIAFGFIAGWFYPSNYWMAFIYVGVITVIVFALDSVKTENDVEDINEMVKLSKNEAVEVKPLKKMYGWKVLVILLAAMTVFFAASLGYSYATREYNPALLIFSAAIAVLAVLLAVYLIIYSISRKRSLR